MVLGFEHACPEESPLESAPMDFIRLRRTQGAASAQQDLSPPGSSKKSRQPQLAARAAPLSFAPMRSVLDMYAPNGCRDGELQRGQRLISRGDRALSCWTAMPTSQILCAFAAIHAKLS